MNITPENKIKILEYKLAFEREILVKKEFDEGNSDLNYRLSFFREKLIKNNNDKKQVESFDNFFMPKDKNTQCNNGSNEIEIHRNAQKSSKKSVNVETWLKKAYRQIAKLTHPDMLVGIKSSKIINQFLNYYNIAQNAYEKNIPADIIMVASDLEVPIDNDIISREIKKSFEEKVRLIDNTMKQLGYQWYQVPEENRDAEFKKILTIMGFKFTDAQVKEVIKSKKPNRKVGKRPEKFSVKRRKLN